MTMSYFTYGFIEEQNKVATRHVKKKKGGNLGGTQGGRWAYNKKWQSEYDRNNHGKLGGLRNDICHLNSIE